MTPERGTAMQLHDRYPALFQLFGAFLHADYGDEFATPGAAVDAFTGEASAAQRAQALAEIDALAADHAQPLERRLDALGLGYDFAADGMNAETFLQWVRARVATA